MLYKIKWSMVSKRICCNQYQFNTKWLKENVSNYNCDYIIYKRTPTIKKWNTIKKDSHNPNLVLLKNLGLRPNISHTYLTHIVNNYDNLYDIEIFLDAKYQDNYTHSLWEQISNCHRYDFKGLGNLEKKLTWNDLDFMIEKKNKYKIYDVKYVHQPPNTKWKGWSLYQKLFPKYCENQTIKPSCDFPVTRMSAYSLFSVKKELIRKYPKSTYKMLLEEFNPNQKSKKEMIENDYIMEHTWKLFFKSK